MKIAFLNRGREAHPGGDVIQLDATMAALRKLGVECVETGWDEAAIRAGNFDMCHLFHCNFDWSWGNYEAVRAAGKKYVLTPIYYPGLLSGITKQQLDEIVLNCSYCLPFSEREAWGDMHYMPMQFDILPNGTDFSFHRPNGHSYIDGLLCVSARGLSDKNVNKVKAACDLANVHFYCAVDVERKDMPEMYGGHKIFVNASDSERMSLTIGEALCAGCRVLATKHNRGNEWYGPGLYTFDPQESVETLAARIQAVDRLSDGQWDWSPNAKARLLTWDLVAAQLKSVYEQVLRG